MSQIAVNVKGFFRRPLNDFPQKITRYQPLSFRLAAQQPHANLQLTAQAAHPPILHAGSERRRSTCFWIKM